MSAIHAHTIDALGVIIQDMRRRMLRHISTKIGVDEDELIEKYCEKPIPLRACNTIHIEGVVVQEGPVFLEPTNASLKQSKSRTVTRLIKKKPDLSMDDLREKLGTEKTEYIDTVVSDIRSVCMCIVEQIGERMKCGEIFHRKETQKILKPLYTLFVKYETSGILTKKQRMNRFNRNLTNVLHGADPTKDKCLRKLARENPEQFFDNLINRVKYAIIENFLSE